MFNPPDPLLQLLLNSPEISGELCAQKLGLSRSAVHKRLEKLRTCGWKISAAPKKGLSLQKPYPFALIPESLRLPIPLFFAEESGSTNAFAKTMVHKAPFILMARSQVKGAGRAGRGWDMQPDKDLAFSYVCERNLPLSQLFSVIRISALAVHSVLSDLGGLCLIKWPNDIVTPEGRKICGILSESIIVENAARTLIIGIGINGNSSGLPSYACSVAGLLGKEVDLNMLASGVILRLEELLSDFPQNEEKVIALWEKNLAWLGESVRMEQGGQSFEGKFLGCEKDGAVVLEIEGKKKIFFAGDLNSVKLRKL